MSTSPYRGGLTATDIPARLCVPDGRCEPCMIKGLRMGVMLLESDAVVQVGTQVSIQVECQDRSQLVEFPVFVRWCGDHCIGVQIDSIGIRETIALMEWLGQRLPTRAAA